MQTDEVKTNGVKTMQTNNGERYNKIADEEFHYAALNGNISVVRLYLNQYVDPNINNNLALRYAICWRNVDIIELLLRDQRLNPCQENNYILQLSKEYGNSEITALILSHLGRKKRIENRSRIR